MLVTGSIAPAFEGRNVIADGITRSSFFRGQRLALVFVSPSCSSCEAIADELKSYQRQSGSELLLLCRGSEGHCADFVRSNFGEVRAILDEEGTVAGRYKVTSTPTAVLLDQDGKILRYGFPRPKLQLGLEDLDGTQTVREFDT